MLCPRLFLHREIAALKYKYNQIMSEKVSQAFLYARQRFFEFGDKPHKLLARQLRKMENDRTIHKIKAKDGTMLTKPKDVNNRFLEFYTDLYTSKSTPNPRIINDFLDKCKLPRLDRKDCELLNKELTVEEVQVAISSLKGCKSPGPDGLSGELYKAFSEELSPYLLKVFEHA